MRNYKFRIYEEQAVFFVMVYNITKSLVSINASTASGK